MLRTIALIIWLLIASSVSGQTIFGSTSAGTSELYIGPNQVRHSRFRMGSVAGTADSITCYVRYEGITDSLGVALYADSAGTPTVLLTRCSARQISESWSTQWYSFALADNVELEADGYYWLSFFAAASSYFRCDDFGAGASDGHFSDPWPPSDPATRGWSANDYTFSIYCTYTVSGAAVPNCRRRRVRGGIR